MPAPAEPADTPARAPLRIVMAAARYLPFTGGIETHINEVGPRMVERGHSVTVLTADPTGRLPPEERVRGMAVVRVPASGRAGDACLAPDFYRRLAAGRGGAPADRPWDVVHVQGYHTLSAPFAMLGALRARVPFVLTFHSGGHSSRLRTALRGLHQRALGPLAGRAARLVGVSQFEADHFSRIMGIPRLRFTVVPNGAALPAPDADASREGDGPLVVSLGRLERYKGHHRAIQAFARLLPQHPGASLRIVGEGPYEARLRDLIARLGLNERVAIGAIPPGERSGMASLLARADLVVLLSDYEAHPVAVMEALSLGRPMVTSDTSGFRELAAQGLVRAVPLDASPDRTAAVMAEAIRAGAVEAPVALPSWDACTDRLLALYRAALDAPRTAPVPGAVPPVGDFA